MFLQISLYIVLFTLIIFTGIYFEVYLLVFEAQYIYIYIYKMCVCVCVCIHARVHSLGLCHYFIFMNELVALYQFLVIGG
jgi:hypothetical protein